MEYREFFHIENLKHYLQRALYSIFHIFWQCQDAYKQRKLLIFLITKKERI